MLSVKRVVLAIACICVMHSFSNAANSWTGWQTVTYVQVLGTGNDPALPVGTVMVLLGNGTQYFINASEPCVERFLSMIISARANAKMVSFGWQSVGGRNIVNTVNFQ